MQSGLPEKEKQGGAGWTALHFCLPLVWKTTSLIPLADEQSIVVIQTRRFALDSGFLLQLEGVEVFGSILNVSFQLCPLH